MRRILLLSLCLLVLFENIIAQQKMKEIIVQENRLSDKGLRELNTNKQVITQEDIQKLSVKKITED
jgi:hypothetical protein